MVQSRRHLDHTRSACRLIYAQSGGCRISTPLRSILAAVTVSIHSHHLFSRWQRNGDQHQELDCRELHSACRRRRALERLDSEPSVRCCGPMRWSLLMGVSRPHAPPRGGDGSCDADGRSDDARPRSGPSRNRSHLHTQPRSLDPSYGSLACTARPQVRPTWVPSVPGPAGGCL